MNLETARLWLVKATLAMTGALFLFLIIAPTFGFPLSFEQAVRLLEIILPVLLGYLGSATAFLVKAARTATPNSTGAANPLMALMVRGPVLLFTVIVSIALIGFAVSNRLDALPGTGMSVDTLAMILSAALGILTATTSALVAFVFSTEPVQ